MVVAVRPPEYFPRLAYAALFLAADVVVLADTLPYSRQSFQNRCRVRTAEPMSPDQPEAGWQWLTVSLERGAPGRPLPEVHIAPDAHWRRVHRKTFLHHLGSAPFYEHYQPGVEALLAAPATVLPDLTVPTCRWTARALHARAAVTLASELPGAPATVPGVLAATGATTLLTLPESAAVDQAHAAEMGVPCRALTFEERPRRQNFPGFVPGCTALDLLSHYGPEAHAHLRSCIRRQNPEEGESV
jgi:hypothetical protein